MRPCPGRWDSCSCPNGHRGASPQRPAAVQPAGGTRCLDTPPGRGDNSSCPTGRWGSWSCPAGRRDEARRNTWRRLKTPRSTGRCDSCSCPNDRWVEARRGASRRFEAPRGATPRWPLGQLQLSQVGRSAWRRLEPRRGASSRRPVRQMRMSQQPLGRGAARRLTCGGSTHSSMGETVDGQTPAPPSRHGCHAQALQGNPAPPSQCWPRHEGRCRISTCADLFLLPRTSS